MQYTDESRNTLSSEINPPHVSAASAQQKPQPIQSWTDNFRSYPKALSVLSLFCIAAL